MNKQKKMELFFLVIGKHHNVVAQVSVILCFAEGYNDHFSVENVAGEGLLKLPFLKDLPVKEGINSVSGDKD